MIKLLIKCIRNAFVEFFSPKKALKNLIQFNAENAINQQLKNPTQGDKEKNEKDVTN